MDLKVFASNHLDEFLEIVCKLPPKEVVILSGTNKFFKAVFDKYKNGICMEMLRNMGFKVSVNDDYDNFKVLRQIHDLGYDCVFYDDVDYLSRAAYKGHLELVKFFIEQDLYKKYSISAVTRAARAGQLDILKYFIEESGLPFDSEEILIEASSEGQYDIVKSIMSVCRFDNEIIREALRAAIEEDHHKIIILIFFLKFAESQKQQ